MSVEAFLTLSLNPNLWMFIRLATGLIFINKLTGSFYAHKCSGLNFYIFNKLYFAQLYQYTNLKIIPRFYALRHGWAIFFGLWGVLKLFFGPFGPHFKKIRTGYYILHETPVD